MKRITSLRELLHFGSYQNIRRAARAFYMGIPPPPGPNSPGIPFQM